ncbi:nitrite/sulfite reductase [Aquaspirillum serpens]|uniref:nitrite/sulfite reductase n=1 Tax=Aquaspirillum serpens TaxID=190 RepID=UPI0003B57452|nr:nitrite/sulfite reductase [Aquaspirillum serpens]
MYQYDEFDRRVVRERVAQFRDQTRRFLAGELSEDEFRVLRLQNGLYIQRHAPMLRVAIPYGVLSSRQLRELAGIARDFDRGYGHFTTRQNIQFNWVELPKVPDILERLAEVDLHAIQTSGNCIRNTTTDVFAGVAADEFVDPRPWCEIIRQWSTLHPEFAFLPRKFKIAVAGSAQDRAATFVHDIGLHMQRNAAGEIGFKVIVGGGLGRTPMIGDVVREFLPAPHLLTYLDAVLRVYNRFGRRDNKYKARIKILVKAMTVAAFAAKVEEEWAHLKDGPATLTAEEIQRVAQAFVVPQYETFTQPDAAFQTALTEVPAFARWVKRNTHLHKQQGYRAAILSLKATGQAPGDLDADRMEKVAEWAQQWSFGEIRVSHEQNLVLPHVAERDLFTLWQAADAVGLAHPNAGLLTDIICCPGGDFCSLANAKSIPVAEAIQHRFADLDYLFDLGDIALNISGCMNACGHHHVGNIGVLGVDKNGEEWYQITLGGHQGPDASLGKVIGPSFARAAMPDVIEKIIQVYVERREPEERFLDTFRRIGIDVFKERVYAKAS